LISSHNNSSKSFTIFKINYFPLYVFKEPKLKRRRLGK